jgi:hypothetical protein
MGMRNTKQYPITLDECIKAVERAYEEEAKKARQPGYPVGGIHMAALHDAYIRLQRLAFAVEDLG